MGQTDKRTDRQIAALLNAAHFDVWGITISQLMANVSLVALCKGFASGIYIHCKRFIIPITVSEINSEMKTHGVTLVN